jgi:hypothetical protein
MMNIGELVEIEGGYGGDVVVMEVVRVVEGGGRRLKMKLVRGERKWERKKEKNFYEFCENN